MPSSLALPAGLRACAMPRDILQEPGCSCPKHPPPRHCFPLCCSSCAKTLWSAWGAEELGPRK